MIRTQAPAPPRPGSPPATELAERLARSAAARHSELTPDPWTTLVAARRGDFRVSPVDLAELDGWSFDPDTGNLAHRTGRFFTVEGLAVRTDEGPVPAWTQPILKQTDVAVLGILAAEFDGVLHLLLQAKMEPGNLDTVQYSPTVQATSSNYKRVHGGRAPHYLEYFTGLRGRVLTDALQSEQGSWFHHKRNRNMVVEVDPAVVPEHPGLHWLTIGQVHQLLHVPHAINMDARSVLAGLPLPLPGQGSGAALMSDAEVVSWVTERRVGATLDARLVPLRSVEHWHRDGLGIGHESGRYFRIVGAEVEAGTREVARWSQPLLAPTGEGLAALVVRRVGGVLHALVQAQVKAGNRDTVEIAPTVLCAPHNHAGTGHTPPLLPEVRSGAGRVLYDVVQSEEGGRFMHAGTRHLVVEWPEDGPDPAEVPPGHAWVSTDQLQDLQRHSNYLSIECRSLLFCLHAAG